MDELTTKEKLDSMCEDQFAIIGIIHRKGNIQRLNKKEFMLDLHDFNRVIISLAQAKCILATSLIQLLPRG